ncbi:MAG: hypothetical protein ACRC7G_17815, partial [Beijerinckiaceae bacterium]
STVFPIRPNRGGIVTATHVIRLVIRFLKRLPVAQAKHIENTTESRDLSRESRRGLLTLG